MNGEPILRAERTLWWAGIALVIGLALVREARNDLGKAKSELRAERRARGDLEDRVDKLHRDLDGALETISRLKDEQPPAP